MVSGASICILLNADATQNANPSENRPESALRTTDWVENRHYVQQLLPGVKKITTYHLEYSGGTCAKVADVGQIREAIRKVLYDQEFQAQVQMCQNPYGDGHAGERIANILAEVPIDERLISKRNTF